MSIEVLKSPEYEIYIPSKTKDKVDIPKEKIDIVVAFIIGKVMENDLGCNELTHVQGYWKDKDGEEVVEANKVIRIVGENPLTNEDIEKITDYLEQECLAIKKTLNCEIQFHYSEIKEKIEYYQQVSDDGEIEYCYVCYNKYGEVTAGGTMTDDERFQFTKEGQEAFQEMMDMPD